MRRVFAIFVLVMLSGCSAACEPAVTMTPDAYLLVGQSLATAEAAQNQANTYGLALTATAQAPIVAVTATAAAFELEMMFASATAASVSATETVAVTQTAAAWTATPNATSTAVEARARAEATQTANALAVDALAVERARMTNQMRAVSGYAAGFLGLVVVMMLGIAAAKRISMVSTPLDASGKPLPWLNVVDGIVTDVDRAANGVGLLSRKDLGMLPAVSAARQDAVTERAQLVDMQARAKVQSAAVRRLMESQQAVSEPRLIGQAGVRTDAEFPLPAWDLVRSWEPKDGIPFGLTASGMGLMDLAKTPHIGALGETGSGKSRRFLRPFIAFCLAAGHRVVIMGKQVDFLPFAEHPNAFIVPVRELTMEGEAERYGAFLRGLTEEMGKRDAWLSSVHKSTWGQAGRETTVVVLDEYSNALDLMPREQRETARRYARGLIREGRKYGFSLVLAAQRAVGLRDEMTNLGRAVFHVADEQESRWAVGMPGAESLREGYFLARFGALMKAGAFEPSDAELTGFLGERRVADLEPLPWVGALSVEDAPRLTVDDFDVRREEVVRLLEAGESPSRVVRDVWGVTGGDKFLRAIAFVKKLKPEGV